MEKISISIRSKVIWVIVFLVAVYVILALFAFNFIVLPKFFELEKSKATTDVRRVESALLQEIKHLERYTCDWAYWDDAYRFMQTRANPFIESNLVPSAFTSNDLNLIYFIDGKGDVVWGGIVDQEGERIELREFPSSFPAGHFAVFPENAISPKSGIQLTEKGPMLVSAVPVLDSNLRGPARGAVVMARFMSAEKVRSLSQQVQVDFRLFRFDDQTLDAEEKELVAAAVKAGIRQPYIRNADEFTNHGYIVLPDISDRPALLLKTTTNRSISQQGKNVVRGGIAFIVLTGLAVALVLHLLLKRMVTGPLADFVRHITMMKEAGQRHSFDEGGGRTDEIGIMTQEFNNLIRQVDHQLDEKCKLINDLETALKEIKTLRGIIPICSSCKNIRNDKGFWQKIESYISERSDADFSHGICPDCAKKLYPDMEVYSYD